MYLSFLGVSLWLGEAILLSMNDIPFSGSNGLFIHSSTETYPGCFLVIMNTASANIHVKIFLCGYIFNSFK